MNEVKFNRTHGVPHPTAPDRQTTTGPETTRSRSLLHSHTGLHGRGGMPHQEPTMSPRSALPSRPRGIMSNTFAGMGYHAGAAMHGAAQGMHHKYQAKVSGFKADMFKKMGFRYEAQAHKYEKHYHKQAARYSFGSAHSHMHAIPQTAHYGMAAGMYHAAATVMPAIQHYNPHHLAHHAAAYGHYKLNQVAYGAMAGLGGVAAAAYGASAALHHAAHTAANVYHAVQYPAAAFQHYAASFNPYATAQHYAPYRPYF
ncbi:hypothetical protein M4R22_05540 [Acidovorax sp. GBBC 3334]|uniref:hypothetical protein n=1 Tax=Acidovorax sp. GBBC 3334 TaxID=2940496 RepID=UPI002302D2D5|nr:hypothetical protein [Acidovorax sp. GBBC 3334]MDA8454220.1 hypothetical protein [Acidovorax sp. GBBC 3334]